MFYVKRDQLGGIEKVEVKPFEGMSGELPSNSEEVILFYQKKSADIALEKLKQSDFELIRVLDDLIMVLIRKGVLSITDFPDAAQVKLISRSKSRDAIWGLQNLINEEGSNIL